MKYLESISFCLAVFIVALGCGGCTHYGYDFVCHDVAADASDSRAGEFARVKSRRLLEVLKTHPCNWESLAVDGHSLLIYAAEHDNIRLARYLIGRGGAVNARGDGGWTALMFAVSSDEREHLDMVRLLVENGADVNAESDSRYTPLELACIGDAECAATVRYLLAHGAKVDARDEDGTTALEEAIRRGYYDSLCALVNSGADLQSKTRFEGMTPLLFAAAFGKTRIVRFLITRGADVYARDDFGATAFMRAAFTGNVETLILLRPTIEDIDDVSSQGESALIYAASAGNLATVRFLLEHGANWTIRATNGRTALDEASHEKHADVIQYMKTFTSQRAEE